MILITMASVAWLTAAPGHAFSPEILNSVVSVLPVWPGFERRARGPRKPGEEPEGTAVAIRRGGYLVTSLHIVARASSIELRLADGRKMPARMVGADRPTDLAVLKVSENLPTLPVGPEPVLAQPVRPAQPSTAAAVT